MAGEDRGLYVFMDGVLVPAATVKGSKGEQGDPGPSTPGAPGLDAAGVVVSDMAPANPQPWETVWMDVGGFDNSFPAPAVRLGRTAALNIPNAVSTAIAWDTERFDSAGFHALTTNTDRITIPAGMQGVYLLGATVRFAAGTTGIRGLDIRKNGVASAIGGESFTASGGTNTINCVTLDNAVAGDYYTANAFQNNGGALGLDLTEGWAQFWAIRVIG